MGVFVSVGVSSVGRGGVTRWGSPSYLVHLDGHGAAGGDGALIGHGPGASVAADIIAGNAVDGAVAQRETGAAASVYLMSATCFFRL